MIRKSLLLFCALTLTTGLSAQKVSIQDARLKAMQFIGQKQGNTRADGNPQLREVNSGATNVYAFNVGDNGGFVLVSGDERTLPILGYSDHGSFDLTNAPENLRRWMKGYEAEIEALQNGTVKVAATRAAAEPYGPSVEPLLKTQWNQDDPYNLMTPKTYGYNAVTGCVATAMAQIMNYWKWPTHAVASMPGYTSIRGFNIGPLDYTYFDWQNMCDTYTWDDNRTEEQNMAVAKLMRYVGQSLKMDYTTEASGASLSSVAGSLKEHFGYAESVTFLIRADHSTKDWETLVYNELAAGRPVAYSGFSDAGHAFVCDGYDRDRYFHINWGWGGLADGNFLLSDLNPGTNAGIGSAGSAFGYNRTQQMVIGIKPADHVVGELPTLIIYQSLEFNTEGKVINTYAHNMSSRQGVFEVALVAIDEEGKQSPIDSTGWFTEDSITAKIFEIASAQTIKTSFAIDLSDKLAPGEYLLYPMVRCLSVPGDEWHSLMPAGQGLLYTVTAEGSTCKVYPAYGLQLEGLVYEDHGAFVPHDVKFAISNHGALDYSDEVTLTLRYQDPENKYESVSRQVMTVGAFIDANATDTVVFNVIPPRGGECKYELSTSDGLSFASGTMSFDDPAEELLHAISIRDYEIRYEKVSTLCMVFLDGKIKNSSPASFMGSFVFDLTIPGEESQQVEIKFGIPGHIEGRVEKSCRFFVENREDNLDIDFALQYKFSPFYPGMTLLTGTLRAGKYLTPDGYKDVYTGITEVQTQKNKEPRITDLMGNDVRNAADGKGLFIINGKKVLKQ